MNVGFTNGDKGCRGTGKVEVGFSPHRSHFQKCSSPYNKNFCEKTCVINVSVSIKMNKSQMWFN